jgi:hypothetical protein
MAAFGKYTEIRKIGYYMLAERHLFSLNYKVYMMMAKNIGRNMS